MLATLHPCPCTIALQREMRCSTRGVGAMGEAVWEEETEEQRSELHAWIVRKRGL